MDALVEEKEQTVVSTIAPGGGQKVTVKNTYTTEIWGRTKWVLEKNLCKTINTSKTLDSKFDGRTITQIFYRTYNYVNSWFSSTMQGLGGLLYPSANFSNVYENKSLYPGGSLSRHLNYFNYLNMPK